MIKKILVD